MEILVTFHFPLFLIPCLFLNPAHEEAKVLDKLHIPISR